MSFLNTLIVKDFGPWWLHIYIYNISRLQLSLFEFMDPGWSTVVCIEFGHNQSTNEEHYGDYNHCCESLCWEFGVDLLMFTTTCICSCCIYWKWRLCAKVWSIAWISHQFFWIRTQLSHIQSSWFTHCIALSLNWFTKLFPWIWSSAQ